MKFIRITEHLLGRFLLLIASAAFLSAAPFVLVENGAPAAVIVVAGSTSESVNDAVDELNYWLERIAGVGLPVIEASEWNGSDPYVAIGSSSLTETKGWSREPFSQEEARVFIEEDGIGLLGNDSAPSPDVEWTGTYYAVLEFVQQELGVRWIWPGPSGEVFTPRSRVVAELGSWSWSPDLFVIRMLRNGYSGSLARSSARSMKTYFDITLDPEKWGGLGEEHDQWLKRERMGYPTNIAFGHAFSKWWDRYSETKPEWFAQPPEGLTQRGGHGVKLNLSNSELQDKIYADWYVEWQEDPIKNRNLNLAPNDSRGFDTRPETRAWDAPEVRTMTDKEVYNGSETVLTDRYVKFWNLLARRIKKVDPEATVSTYAYRNYQKPPLDQELQVESNVVIAYVGGEGYYPDEGFIRDEWKGWNDQGAQLSWRPNLLHGGHGIPYNYSKQLFDDFDFFRQHGLLGTDFDALVGNWSGQGLAYYVLAEQHSRPDASYEVLCEEYYSAFGPAAQQIQEFNEYFAELTQNGPDLLRRPGVVPRMTWGGWWIGHVRIIPMLLTPEVIAEGQRILAEAEEAVSVAQPIYSERVDLIVRGFTHTKLMSEAFAQLNLDDPMSAISHDDAIDVLRPLWDFRMNHLTDLAIPTARYFTIEQQKLQLWNSFRGNVPTKPESRKIYPLPDGWFFKADRDNLGNGELWQQDWSDEAWTPVEVAMPWRKSLPDEDDSQVVWYRLNFEVPELADTGELVVLRFGSVDAETKLWVNDQLVDERGYPHDGNYDSWAQSFEVDITSVAKSGAMNNLILRVESEQQNGGITGPVSLIIGD
ncbi:DUF4838 domain-containing protein [Coraliomargarita sp. SDUM461004]|uniref:DUF4838 domain-containing protein n=1 Tax=Thalassobacterium sedimentorum TaxID=3041258 RepID=A0ABU1AJ18_9BACT|nr:DUF4838 domain-containing protein [Coraliomargarita sp. SDUM461004]MDQ8194816.1 DUF4838 domain-containing protein [Coraliomargarita sp. SDUM461004]